MAGDAELAVGVSGAARAVGTCCVRLRSRRAALARRLHGICDLTLIRARRAGAAGTDGAGGARGAVGCSCARGICLASEACVAPERSVAARALSVDDSGAPAHLTGDTELAVGGSHTALTVGPCCVRLRACHAALAARSCVCGGSACGARAVCVILACVLDLWSCTCAQSSALGLGGCRLLAMHQLEAREKEGAQEAHGRAAAQLGAEVDRYDRFTQRTVP